MKRLLLKLANWVFFLGLAFCAVGIWHMYKERNVSSTPTDMEVSSIADPQEDLIYASIHGGSIDITNTYEYSVKTKKSDVTLKTEYYIPIMVPDSEKVAYIFKSHLKPTNEQLLTTPDYTGLLSSTGSIPEKIRSAYESTYPGQHYYLLDTSFKPKTIWEQLADLKIFVIMMIVGLIGRIALSPKAAVPAAG